MFVFYVCQFISHLVFLFLELFLENVMLLMCFVYSDEGGSSSVSADRERAAAIHFLPHLQVGEETISVRAR